jgi:predicted phosphodiesterase
MKILGIADEESAYLWDANAAQKLKDYDLILSCGDLKPDYLSFLVTVAKCPVLYVHGNHDGNYQRRPPEGCDCIEDKLVVYNGVRILGLGGSMRYRPGPHQYTDRQMRRRIQKLRLTLWRAGGVDIVVTHAPPREIGDGEDLAHRGFEALRELLDKYQPQYLLHGHVHLSYGADTTRLRQYGDTGVINVSDRYVLEIPDREVKPRDMGRLIWRNGAPKLPEDTKPVSLFME